MRRYFSSLHPYKEHLTTIIFVVGIVIDMLILPDIEDPKARYFGMAYLTVIGSLILFREWIVSRNRVTQMEERIYGISTFGIVCFSGSALSFVCIYAWRSAALSVSWPLFLIFILCILANELVSTHSFRFTLDVGVFFIAMLFYIVFNVPILVKQQNDSVFGLAVVCSIAISLLYTYILKHMSDSARFEASRIYALAFGIPMFVGMLYFLNVLPAVPLSLASGGVYHNIIRTESGDFIGQAETDTRPFSSLRTDVYHLTPEDSGVYFFSAVDAPAKLSAPLSHVWEYYDEKTKKWIPTTTISFTLEGGRENGYRAYSKKENIVNGLWRVTVNVDGNRVIGRVTFEVVRSNQPVTIVETKI